VAIAAAVLWWSASKNMLEQENGHPLSLTYLQSAADFEFGEFKDATVPKIRREHVRRELAALGLREQSDIDALQARTEERGTDRPNEEGLPFIPRSAFIGD
jgi:hypothetical protein